MNHNLLLVCHKHKAPYQYVQFNTNTNPFKCLQCDDLSFDNPSQLTGIDEWIAKSTNTAFEATKTYHSFVDSVGKQIWDQIQYICKQNLNPQYNNHSQINAINCKARIQEEFNQLKDMLNIKIQILQLNIESQIDEQFNSFNENLEYCQRIMQESEICQSVLPYSNQNNIHIALQQASQQQCIEFFKKMQFLEQNQITLAEKKLFIQQFRGATVKLNECCDQSGMIILQKFKEPIESLTSRIVEEISKAYGGLNNCSTTNNNTVLQQQQIIPLQVATPNSTGSPFMGKENNYFSNNPIHTEANSCNGTPLQSNRQHLNKQSSSNQSISPQRLSVSPLKSRLEYTTPLLGALGNKCLLLNQIAKAPRAIDTIVKPLKKYQIDFAVAAIEVITDSMFALTCSNDPYLRIFDTIMKRIHTLQAHSNPIIQIDKSHTSIFNNTNQIPLKAQNNNLNQQQQPQQKGWSASKYIFTLSIDSFVVWVFENSQNNTQLQAVPQIFLKLKCPDGLKKICYLQDGNNVTFGDNVGAISVYNFQTQKYQFQQLEKQHNKAILNMFYINKTKKLIILSEDQKFSIWKLIYSCYPRQHVLESLKSEQIIQNLDLGTVRIIQPLHTDSDYVIITNEEGQIRLINLISEKIEVESSNVQYQYPVVDLNVVEETNTNDNDISYCVLALCTQMKSLRLWKVQRQGKVWNSSESRIEIAMQLGDNIMRSKLQFVQLFNSNYYILIANENGKELLVYEVTTK